MVEIEETVETFLSHPFILLVRKLSPRDATQEQPIELGQTPTWSPDSRAAKTVLTEPEGREYVPCPSNIPESKFLKLLLETVRQSVFWF